MTRHRQALLIALQVSFWWGCNSWSLIHHLAPIEQQLGRENRAWGRLQVATVMCSPFPRGKGISSPWNSPSAVGKPSALSLCPTGYRELVLPPGAPKATVSFPLSSVFSQHWKPCQSTKLYPPTAVIPQVYASLDCIQTAMLMVPSSKSSILPAGHLKIAVSYSLSC